MSNGRWSRRSRAGWEWVVTLAVVGLMFVAGHLWERQVRLEQAYARDLQARIATLERRLQAVDEVMVWWLDEQTRPYSAPGAYPGGVGGTGRPHTPWGLWPE